ncbi:NADPH:quinone reductase, partial [Mycobacterium tuberculosis]|nr:NADPH:quinone reductase [Mycobacterium tuberculosis]
FVVNGITAWQMLFRTAKVRAGQTILVHGANGGVGSTLVQLARAHGIHVNRTASPRHPRAAQELGAPWIDYPTGATRQVPELAPGGLAAVFD